MIGDILEQLYTTCYKIYKLAYKNKLQVKVAKDLIYNIFFEPRNTVVNVEVASKAIGDQYKRAWIGIRTDPVPAQRHFYWLSGGPFTSLSYGNWGPG